MHTERVHNTPSLSFTFRVPAAEARVTAPTPVLRLESVRETVHRHKGWLAASLALSLLCSAVRLTLLER
jgi:predicted metal-dependent hydrolase